MRDWGQGLPGHVYGSTGGAHHAGEIKTPFATGEDIDSMRAMLVDAKPEQVLGVADAWEQIHDHLVNGGGSVQGDFDRIVKHVLQHWEGESAEAFARVAAKISRQLADCATYARYTSAAMRNAGERLSEIKPKVEAIGTRDGVGGAMNGTGDAFARGGGRLDGGFRGDFGGWRAVPDSGDGGLGSPSEGEEEDRSKAVALMVDLALTYNSQRQAMSSWQKKLPPAGGREEGEYPGEPGGIAPFPGPMSPGESAPSAAAVAAARAAGGASAGKSAPKPARPAPGSTSVAATKQAAMRFDGISGGTATAPIRGGTSPGVPEGGVPGGFSGAVDECGLAASSRPRAVGGVAGGPGGAGGPEAGDREGARGGVPVSRGTGGSVPAGLGAGPGGGPGDAGGPGAGKDTRKGSGPADGRGLHLSRGGSLAGERGRNGGSALFVGGALGGLHGGPLHDGGESKYCRRAQDGSTWGGGERPGGFAPHDET